MKDQSPSEILLRIVKSLRLGPIPTRAVVALYNKLSRTPGLSGTPAAWLGACTYIVATAYKIPATQKEVGAAVNRTEMTIRRLTKIFLREHAGRVHEVMAQFGGSRREPLTRANISILQVLDAGWVGAYLFGEEGNLPEPVDPQTIARKARVSRRETRAYLHELAREGKIVRESMGRWVLLPEALDEPERRAIGPEAFLESVADLMSCLQLTEGAQSRSD